MVRIGNRCGHVPYAPRVFEKQSDIWLIEKIKRRLERSYFTPQKSRLYSHKHRIARSEAREAMLVVGQMLTHYIELSSLTIGFHDKTTGEFRPPTIKQMAKVLQLSAIRVKRALKWLESKGYLKTSQVKYRHDDKIRSKAAIRALTPRFFIELGISYQKIVGLSHWKRKRLEKKQARRFIQFKQQPKELSPAVKKNLMDRALALHLANPTYSCGEYYKALLAKLE